MLRNYLSSVGLKLEIPEQATVMQCHDEKTNEMSKLNLNFIFDHSISFCPHRDGESQETSVDSKFMDDDERLETIKKPKPWANFMGLINRKKVQKHNRTTSSFSSSSSSTLISPKIQTTSVKNSGSHDTIDIAAEKQTSIFFTYIPFIIKYE
jgi:hypothetical protein